jgi:hypothetical protein
MSETQIPSDANKNWPGLSVDGYLFINKSISSGSGTVRHPYLFVQRQPDITLDDYLDNLAAASKQAGHPVIARFNSMQMETDAEMNVRLDNPPGVTGEESFLKLTQSIAERWRSAKATAQPGSKS